MPSPTRCPFCLAPLVPGKGINVKCKTEGCVFIDRRSGNTVLDADKDRRGKGPVYVDKNDVWHQADRKGLR